ncbi:GNAT family N-acetyltransferase [Gordonia jinhuaensis]|uniref:N-acetyltransferase domain-containing protein n=1 Tax=Gordonia jinhuaensis TaxID=1517702 RepID=A0A916THI4_9ACTN|nr:GNAT family N-acetyltransferase [Gordonia jinhuaensis]GGB45488.1 hypothetical protein GCM10011489_36160 [Gordonia jinhuaensis]
MTDLDRAATRRDIADALESAFDRRHEVLDAIVGAETREDALDAVGKLLGKSELGARAVLGMSLQQLTKSARRNNAAELEDLNTQLTFALTDRPASTGDTVTVRAFDVDTDTALFAARTAELGVAGDGSGAPASGVDDEVRAALARVDDEEAAWLVAVDGDAKVGMVFGELRDGEIDVRVWIHPEYRKRGYAVAALRHSRPEMAAQFPGVPMVIRGASA